MMAVLADLAKMGVQLCGALLIALLTVRWALGRYKAEKSWERETQALVDLMSAVGELQEIVLAWYSEEVGQSGGAAELIQNRRRERYWLARERLSSVAAISDVVLPRAVAEIVAALQKGIERGDSTKDYDNWLRQLEVESDALAAAKAALVRFASSRRA